MKAKQFAKSIGKGSLCGSAKICLTLLAILNTQPHENPALFAAENEFCFSMFCSKCCPHRTFRVFKVVFKIYLHSLYNGIFKIPLSPWWRLFAENNSFWLMGAFHLKYLFPPDGGFGVFVIKCAFQPNDENSSFFAKEALWWNTPFFPMEVFSQNITCCYMQVQMAPVQEHGTPHGNIYLSPLWPLWP